MDPTQLQVKTQEAIYWANKDIKVRFTIFEKYPNGSSQYSELHEVTTDDYGVFNVIIGQGMAMSGDFERIPWELGTAHLQVEIDFESTNTFTLTSLERFWSVPYAFATKQTEGSNVDSLLNELRAEIDSLRANDLDTVVGNEIQSLSIKGDSLSISEGNTVKLSFPKSLDNDTTNEIQTISISNDTISLSNGGGSVTVPKNWTLKDSTITNNSKYGSCW